jgi:hypothetical protein
MYADQRSGKIGDIDKECHKMRIAGLFVSGRGMDMVKSNAIKAPITIDVEASGFGQGSYPIEVGVALEDGRTCCFLIRPAPGWTHWDAEAEAVHGITRDLLLAHGHPAEEVAKRLNDLLKYKTVYSDAWGHDQSWLALLFEEAGLPRRFRVESLRSLLEEVHLEAWQDEKAAALVGLKNARHRASNDALVLQRTLLEIFKLQPTVPEQASTY